MTLIIAGLGIKSLSHLTKETEAVISSCDKVLYLTNDFDVLKQHIEKLCNNSESLNKLYFSSDCRRLVYSKIEEKIIVELNVNQTVCFIVYGHPTYLVQVSQSIVTKANELDHDVHILPAISSLDCLFSDLQLNFGDFGLQVFEATEMVLHDRVIDVMSHVVIHQVGALGFSGHFDKLSNQKKAKQLLMKFLFKFYDRNCQVILYEAAQYPGKAAKIDGFNLFDLPAYELSSIATFYIAPQRNPNISKQHQSMLRNLYTPSEKPSI